MPQAQHDGQATLDGLRGAHGNGSIDGRASSHRLSTEGDLINVASLLTEIEGLRQRLASQPVIEQAKGILMSYYGIDDDAAFRLLRRWSQESNTKIRLIAEVLTASAVNGEGRRVAPHDTIRQAVPSPQRGLDA